MMEDEWGDFAGPAPVSSPAPAPASTPPVSSPAQPAPSSIARPADSPSVTVHASAPSLNGAHLKTREPIGSNSHPNQSAGTPPKSPQRATQPLVEEEEFDDFSKPQSLDSIAAYLAKAVRYLVAIFDYPDPRTLGTVSCGAFACRRKELSTARCCYSSSFIEWHRHSLPAHCLLGYQSPALASAGRSDRAQGRRIVERRRSLWIRFF